MIRDAFDLLPEIVGRGILESGGRVGRMVSNIQVDLKETDSSYVVEANVSEYKKADVKVTFEKNVLTISGEKNSDSENKEDGMYLIRERSHSSFNRALRIPSEVVEDAIKASYNDGILTITLPKVEKEPAPKAKNINIE